MKNAYLTIDDCPHENFYRKIDYLDSLNIKAIAYCLGRNLEQYRDEAVYAIKQGHLLGNHSYDHPRFSDIPVKECQDQINRTETLLDAVYQVSGQDRPYKTFRFPYLDYGDGDNYGRYDCHHPRVVYLENYLKQKGFIRPPFQGIQYNWYNKYGYKDAVAVGCTYDTFDWCLTEGAELEGYHDLPTILARMDEDVPEAGRGLNDDSSAEIVMMHGWIHDGAFRAIIDKLLEKGLTFLPSF